MRKVAGYLFEQSTGSTEFGNILFISVCASIDEWLNAKGKREDEKFIFTDDRQGRQDHRKLEDGKCHLAEYSLHEPTEAGPIQTDIKVGLIDDKVIFYLELRASAPLNWLSPVAFNIRCPSIVRTILDRDENWQLDECPLSTKPIEFHGAAAAHRLELLIWHTKRNLPVICISQDDEGPLTIDIAKKLAADLSGLAIVTSIDASASWEITKNRGKEWSCFNGAMRLYWPNLSDSDPIRHPLWTKFQLLRNTETPEEASRKIRRQLRKRILGFSAFSINEPIIIRKFREKIMAEHQHREREQLQNNSQWEKLADEYSRENKKLQDELSSAKDDINDLQIQLLNLQEVLSWKETTDLEVAPQKTLPPSTVLEAVDRGRKLKNILFGDDVNKGIDSLSSDAGPPDKILAYLEGLQKLAETLSKGPLGVSQVQWLKSQGFTTSGESETILNSKDETRKRTWSGINGKQKFEKHMKPSDNVSPDKCVRIYFDFDPEMNCVVVGWVGRHPE